MIRLQRTLVSSAALVCLLACAFRVTVWSWADHLSRGSELVERERAAAIGPTAANHVRLAEKRASLGGNPLPDLRSAADLEPEDPDIRQRLGIHAELAGDLPLAEHSLLRAAALSRLYQPRYLLAQYYFRRQDTRKFRHWSAAALGIARGNVLPMVDLCWRMNPDPAAYARLAATQRPAIAAEFLSYMVTHGFEEASPPVALHLARIAPAQLLPHLYLYWDKELGEGRGAVATEIWNILCRRGMLPYHPLEPARPRLTNPGLSEAPLGRGFDWHLQSDAEVTVTRASGEMRVEFSGKQPETRMIAWQYVPAQRGKICRLAFEARAIDALSTEGIVGRISYHSMEGHWRELPPGTAAPGDLLHVGLVYRKPAGSVRLTGTVAIGGLRLDCGV